MKKKKNETKIDESEKLIEEVATNLVVDPRTREIVLPYAARSNDIKEALICLKCIAGLLILEGEERESICKSVYKERSAFLLMLCRELDRIIEEEIQ